MSAETAVAATGSVTDLLDEYLSWVDDLEMTPQGKRLRRLAAERFVVSYPDLDNWMTRPTPARVADLHRSEAWTFLTWCFCVGHLSPDLDLLTAKNRGSLYVTWARFHPDDVARASEVGRRLGWADSWTHLVCVTGMGMVCLWAQKEMDELSDGDPDDFEHALDKGTSG